MLDIRYKRARTIDDAIHMATSTRGKVYLLCGGTDLTVKAKAGKIGPSTWIDLSRIEDLQRLEDRPVEPTREEEEGLGSVYIGAAVTYARLERTPWIRERLPALAQATRDFGSPQIRSLGTLGGNFANASPAADGVPPLIANDATVHVAGPKGRRDVPSAAFATAPGRSVLVPGELIVGFSVPYRAGQRAAFLKLGPRKSLSIAKVSVTVMLEATDERVDRIAIVLGAVAPTIVRAPQTEAFLSGRAVTEDVLAQAQKLVRTECSPITDFRSTAAYRRRMVGTLLVRGLRQILDIPEHRQGWDVEMR